MYEFVSKRQRRRLEALQPVADTPLTIVDVRRINHEAGHTFFDKRTSPESKFKLYPQIYQGPGGVYFVTSQNREGRREYVVRRLDLATGRVVGAGGGFKFKNEAVKRAESLAGGAS